MANLITYREAVAAGIAQEMRRDQTVVCLGEDIGAAEGVFKTAAGRFAEFGPERVWDTPISELGLRRPRPQDRRPLDPVRHGRVDGRGHPQR